MIFVKKLYKELIQQVLLVFLVLTLILSIGQMIKLLNFVTTGKITTVAFFKLMALSIPSMFGVLIPPSLLLALLLVLSRYYLDSEMVVMFSSGVSLKRVFLWVGIFSLGFMLLVGGVVFVVSPYTAAKRKLGLKYALMDVSLDKVIPGRFTRLSDQAVIYATREGAQGKGLDAVYLFSKQPGVQRGMWRVLQAQHLDSVATVMQQDSGPFFQFDHGYFDSISARELQWRTSDFSRFLYEAPGFQQVVDVWPRNLALPQLWQAAHGNPQLYHTRLALGLLLSKLSTVVSVLVVSLWGCALGYAKPRQGKVSAFLPALILFGLYNYLLSLLQKNLTNGTWFPWESFMLIHGGAMLVGVFILLFRFRDSLWSCVAKRGRA